MVISALELIILLPDTSEQADALIPEFFIDLIFSNTPTSKDILFSRKEWEKSHLEI